MNRSLVLFLNVLIVASCGLIYELLTGTLASYVLGDSITQFSVIIGIYLASMGVGAWLTGYVDTQLARRFVEIELAIALIGGLSAPMLFLSFAYLRYFQLCLYITVALIGALVGMELPLLMRILQDRFEFKDLVSKVMMFDYIGALFASILFPMVLVPKLGLVRTSLTFGLLNAVVGLWAASILAPDIKKGLTGLRIRGVLVIVFLLICLICSNKLTSLAEDGSYSDEILYARSTPYQRIVMTRGRAGFQLFLNGHLQFSSSDEYRYHESLVHPAMMLQERPKRVLVMGGGDGLALREILKYPSVETVTLVDLDPDMTGLSNHFPPLADLNKHAFNDPRVTVVNQDAMIWLESDIPPFDTAIIDFPDPNSYAVGKLYTTRFYRMLKKRLTPNASFAVQSTSPLFARSSYWCIVKTIEAAGYTVRPYQMTVPSFGVWGFTLARPIPFEPGDIAAARAPAGLRFLNEKTLPGMFMFSEDMAPLAVEINRLDNQSLVRYYESEWRKWE
ncbi:MAG: polyamine aminopropyltransferase [Planctomycetota bacterium]